MRRERVGILIAVKGVCDFGRLWMQRESVGILIAVKGVWDFARL